MLQSNTEQQQGSLREMNEMIDRRDSYPVW